jgi:HPr kinase/phosphorylase
MQGGETQLHGSFVEVRGLGVLLLGPSGVGKSECLIELVRRGHRMVADDVVRLRVAEGHEGARLIGWSPETIRHYVEVRGLGLLCLADLFGAEAILDECEVGFVCRLEAWQPGRSFERVGLERAHERFLGIDLPAAVLPVHAASNLATLVELAARDWQQRERGVNAARRLDERLKGRAGMLDEAGGLEGGSL